MFLERSFTQPLTCRSCGLAPKNSARALASRAARLAQELGMEWVSSAAAPLAN